MAVMAQLNNPVKQPDFVEIQDVVNIIPALKAGRCRAARLLDKFYKKTSDEDKKDLKVIYTSPTYPDQTVTVSARVPAPSPEYDGLEDLLEGVIWGW